MTKGELVVRHNGNIFIRHSTAIGIVGITILMVMVSVMFYRQGMAVHHAKVMVMQSYDVKRRIDLLFNRLKDAEIGQRGYLVTGSPDYLQAYHEAVGDPKAILASPNTIYGHLATLKRFTADNPAQVANIKELERLINVRVKRLDDIIRIREKNTLAQTAEALKPLRGKQMMDNIDHVVQDMVAEENRLLAIRAQVDEKSTHQNFTLMFCGIALFFISFALAVLLATRHWRQARRMETILYGKAEELQEANRQVSESRMFLRGIIDSVADPIFVKDRQHRWVEGNKALWQLFGLPEGELLGKTDYDFFPKEESDVFWEKDNEVFTTGQPNINIEKFTDAAGITHTISTKKACFNAGGETLLVGVIRDITELTELQEKLKESDEARIKAIMNHSGRPVYIKDLEGRYLQINKTLEELIHLPESEVLGKTDYDFFPQHVADQFRKNDHTVIYKRAATEFEETIDMDGITRIYTSVKFPLYDAHNRIYAVCGISTDISDRKRAEADNALLASIVASSEDAIISKTPQGIITSWNRSAERLFGYEAGEAIGMSITALIPPDRLEEEKFIMESMRNGRSIEHYETMRLRKNGTLVDISLTVSPILDASGALFGASIVARDISDRRMAEEQLHRYMKELVRSNQELDDFAYIASHDLKEPLRGLFNHATFLIEDYADKLGEDGVRRLKRLSQLSQRMETLINDLLYFSRLGRTSLAVQEIDPTTIINEIQQMMEGFLKERNARIAVQLPMPRIVCDRPRITEVFRNLITNGVKYNDKEERLVEVGFLESANSPQGPQQNVFYVRDNGIGIEPEFHEEIFRIFKQLRKDGGDSESGTGAGLTFVKKIIDRHKGDIWLESQPGKGSTFYFTLGRIDL